DIQRVWMEKRKTALFITHSIPEAVLLGDPAGGAGPRPGRIVEIIAIDLPRPRRLDKLPRSLQALQAAERLKDSLKRGFTSIRDAGGADWGLAIACETGLIAAPRLFYP
ncbi:hypothetical protein JNW93_14970, partial [Lacticaseibacillus rhamnosus]|nr:hypothetical protein [Lacticaseibacillus rhamnosus]